LIQPLCDFSGWVDLGRKGAGGQVSQAGMRLVQVVVLPPDFDLASRVGRAEEPRGVQTLLP
jgi:hypothetical protein